MGNIGFLPSNQFWEDDQAWEGYPLSSCPVWVGPLTILGQYYIISLHNQLVLNAGKFRKIPEKILKIDFNSKKPNKIRKIHNKFQ